MSNVNLTGNFLATARCLIFADSASGVWSFNPNTNTLTITAAGGGTGFANPTATVGLTAVNGSATTMMRSDAAPGLSQAIVPTWTGAHIFTPGSGVAITVNGVANSQTLFVDANAASGQSYGLLVRGGTTSGDYAALISNQANSANFLQIYGDGHGYLGASSTAGLSWDTSGNLTASNNTTLTTGVTLGTAAAKTVGFYGMTPAAQTASNSSMVTSNVSSVLSTVATASSTALTTAVNATINAHGSAIIQNGKMLQQVINVLQAIGIYATH